MSYLSVLPYVRVYTVFENPPKNIAAKFRFAEIYEKVLSCFICHLDRAVCSDQFTQRPTRCVCFMLRTLIRCMSFFKD
jgi:hypothetical protein